jgi:hypothetical protein
MLSIPARPRALLLTVALALAPLTAAVPVGAQGSPEAAVDAVLDAIEAKDFDGLPDLVCAAEREAVVGRFDLTAAFEGIPGIDGEALAAGLSLSIEDRSVSLLSQDAESAVVSVSGRLTGEIDEEVARTFVRQLLEASGQEASDEAVDSFVPMLMDPLEEGTDLGSDIEVVLEDGAWLVCGDLGGGEEPYDADATPEPVENSLCELLGLDEINDIGPVQYDFADAYVSDSCTWEGDYETSFHSLSAYLQPETSLEQIRGAYPDGTEVTVAGRDALQVGSELYVDLAPATLVLFAALDEAPGAEGVDPGEYIIAIAEVLVPRILER